VAALAVLSVLPAATSGDAADIDRSAVDFTAPADIKCVRNAAGTNEQAVLFGGTWWMGTGEKFDPDSTVPAPAGSYVIHYARKVHYDGAKGEETIIQVWGMEPATSTPAEKRLAHGRRRGPSARWAPPFTAALS
jgi:hypothetical protein